MHPPTVLHIDDDVFFHKLSVKACEGLDEEINLIPSEGGRQALELLQSRVESKQPLPDMILLDLNMPTMSGGEVLQKLQMDSVLRSIPVMILTAQKGSSDMVSSYDGTSVFYIVKPNKLEDLTSLFGFVLDFCTKAQKQ